MKILLKFCFFSFFIVQVQANTYTNLTSQEKLASRAIWKLQDETGNISTGFFISPNRIITEFHGLIDLLQTNELKNIKLLQKTDQGEIVTDIKITKIVALLVTSNLVILETDTSAEHYLEIRTNPVKETEVLFILGYTNRHFSKIRQAEPLQILFDQLIVPVNQFDLTNAYGSPLLSTDNQVTGIVSSSTENILHSIQAKQLNQFIKGKLGFHCETYNTRSCMQKALKLTVEKAKKGNANALFQLSFIYSKGILVKQDTAKALFLTEQAARRNHPMASYILGRMYSKGKGVKKNIKTAKKWLIKSAEQNSIPALILLQEVKKTSFIPMLLRKKSNKYNKGNLQELERQASWIQKSAEQGNDSALKLLQKEKKKELTFIQKCRKIFKN